MDTADKITQQIQKYEDWRGELLAELRKLINETAPELTEEFKWGVPVWTHNGLVCAISAFKDHVKMNFFKGAFLNDPNHLFNSGTDSKEHRSINFAEGDKPDIRGIKELLHSAVTYNG
jgi:hypothetical protein